MMQPGPSALEQLLMQQKQKQQRGHGTMNPPHWRDTQSGCQALVRKWYRSQRRGAKPQAPIGNLFSGVNLRVEAGDGSRREPTRSKATARLSDRGGAALSSLFQLCLSIFAFLCLWGKGGHKKHLIYRTAQHVAAAEPVTEADFEGTPALITTLLPLRDKKKKSTPV